MKLGGINTSFVVRYSLYGEIVRVSEPDTRPLRKACLVDREPVILTRDKDATGALVAYGMVDPVVAKLHFLCFCSDRLRNELMPEADAKERSLSDQ